MKVKLELFFTSLAKLFFFVFNFVDMWKILIKLKLRVDIMEVDKWSDKGITCQLKHMLNHELDVV